MLPGRFGRFSFHSSSRTSNNVPSRLRAVVETMGVVLSWCIACRLWQEFGLIFCWCSQVLHGLQRWERFLLGVLGSCCKCPDLGTSLLPRCKTSVLTFGCCCALPLWWCYSLGMLVGWIGGLRWSWFRGFGAVHPHWIAKGIIPCGYYRISKFRASSA